MALNPFDDNDPDTRELIERRAYHLWEADGRPHGRPDEYWERARTLVHMEAAGPTGQLAPDAPEVVEDAAIQENLGEFPDRFADQGEKTAVPKARASARPRRAAVAAPAPTPAPAPAAPVAKKNAKPTKAAEPEPAPRKKKN